jgi:zinc protease
LAQGTSSRLYRRLVYEAQLATSANAENHSLGDYGLFFILISLKPSGSREAVNRIVQGEIWNARNKLFSDEDLQKAKNQVMKGYVDFLKTIHGKAHGIGMAEVTLGSYEKLLTDLEKYSAVTREQVKEVANRYLNPTQRITVTLKPGKKTAQGGGQ